MTLLLQIKSIEYCYYKNNINIVETMDRPPQEGLLQQEHNFELKADKTHQIQEK